MTLMKMQYDQWPRLPVRETIGCKRYRPLDVSAFRRGGSGAVHGGVGHGGLAVGLLGESAMDINIKKRAIGVK